MTVGRLQHNDYTFQHVTPRGEWRWTTRLDVSGSVPSFSIRDIFSPYGLLRDSIPLPGEVVESMAGSITTLMTAFAPAMLIGPPVTLTFTVDEGAGYSASQDLVLTNTGAFGSLLQATLTPSAAFIRVAPSTVGGLLQGETSTAGIQVNATTLTAALSPYAGAVTAVSPSATNTPQVLPLVIIVRPKATIAVLPLTLTFSVVKPITGPFPAIAPQGFALQNTGPIASLLAYGIQKITGLSPWLTSILPSSGSVPGGTFQSVTVTVVPPDTLLPGTYTETLRISGYSTNFFVDLPVTLVVT